MRTLQSAFWFGEPSSIDDVSGSPSIQKRLIRGAIREDDLWLPSYKPRRECNVARPDSDPWGNIMRVFNHFYGLVHEASLACGYLSESTSVGRALGLRDSFAIAPVHDSARRNHFSYTDARHQMWLALTDRRGATEVLEIAAFGDNDGISRASLTTRRDVKVWRF